MRCPNCTSELVLSEDKLIYETLEDRICCIPEGISIPPRHYYCCQDNSCYLWRRAFWDSNGYYYSVGAMGAEWGRLNQVDSCRKGTFKNGGTEALGSLAHNLTISECKNRKGLRGLINEWSRLLGNWGIELRRQNGRYVWYPKSDQYTRKTKFWYSLGVWTIGGGNKFRNAGLKRIRDEESNPIEILNVQYLHHPYPWVRRKMKRTLIAKCLKLGLNFDEELSKLRNTPGANKKIGYPNRS